jgi:hypothetical protein
LPFFIFVCKFSKNMSVFTVFAKNTLIRPIYAAVKEATQLPYSQPCIFRFFHNLHRNIFT